MHPRGYIFPPAHDRYEIRSAVSKKPHPAVRVHAGALADAWPNEGSSMNFPDTPLKKGSPPPAHPLAVHGCARLDREITGWVVDQSIFHTM
jgi:hypothetical protein